MAHIPASEQIGKVLGGKYRLISLLGEGGMGRVFAAEHILLGRQVAVKVLHPALEGNPELAERFLREARSASSIEHPGIIDVLDADRDDSGALYMVMELLQGENLSDFLKRQEVVEPWEAVEIARQILDALYCAHEQGIIHRDLKPDNIFLVAEGGRGSWVRILDFGISKAMSGGEEELKLTRTGVVLGTPHYMAPEQARGGSELDHRIDIWAIGVILYQMLAGHRPYGGTSYNEVMLKIAVDPLPSLAEAAPNVPPSLVRCVEGALEKDPAQRYGSVAEMVQAMERAAADLGQVRLEETIATPQPPMASSVPSELQRTGGTEPMGSPVSVTADESAGASGVAPGRAELASTEVGGQTIPARREVGGFWRRTAAVAIDLLIFGMVIGAPMDALLEDSDFVEVRATAKPGGEARDEAVTQAEVAAGEDPNGSATEAGSLSRREWGRAKISFVEHYQRADWARAEEGLDVILAAVPDSTNPQHQWAQKQKAKLAKRRTDSGEPQEQPEEGAGLEPVTRVVTLGIGEPKTIFIGKARNVDVDNPAVIDVKEHPDGDKLLVFGLKEGYSRLSFEGVILNVTVTTAEELQIRELQRDVERLIAKIPGVSVSRMGNRLVLDGVVQREEDLDRVNAIVALDTETLRSLVSLKNGNSAPTVSEGARRRGVSRSEGADRSPADVAKVSVSNLNIENNKVRVMGDGGDEVLIDENGILIREAGGDEVRIDKTGVHIRQADGKETHVEGLNLSVTPTLATTLKVSLWIVFCTTFLALFAATPGKMVFGLKVVQAGKGGQAPGPLPMITALVRSAMFIISLFALGLGCLWSLLDSKRRTWHDRIARTRVIRARD